MIAKVALQALLLILPWKLRRPLLCSFFGYRIAPSARIGFSIVAPTKLIMAENSHIGHLTFCRSLDRLELAESAVLGNLNWISATPLNHPLYFIVGEDRNRDTALVIERHAGIGHRHLFDCTNSIHVGEFTIVAGWGSQFITHGVDINVSRNTSKPIVIGKYCMVGTRVIMLKGAVLPSHSVLAAGSVLNSPQQEAYSLYSGCPAKKVRDLDPDAGFYSRDVGCTF